MNKNYPHILLFILCSLFGSLQLYAVTPPVPSTKDSLAHKTRDTTLQRQKKQQQLNYLRQLATLQSAQQMQATPLKSPQGDNSPLRLPSEEGAQRAGDVTSTALKPTTNQFRSFPTLDQKLTENINFNVSFTNSKPEFTPEFIKANFEQNPVAEKLKKQAKGALEAVAKLGNFVDIITGNELLELPVGLKKQDQTSGNTVELAITEVKFTPGYAQLKVWARVTVPEKGEVKDEKDRGIERELFFGAENVTLSYEGGLSGDMKLVLLGNQAIPIQGDNWLLTLKGGIDLKTGNFENKSFVEFSCSDLKGISLEGDLRISRNVLLPIDENGAYTCGDTNTNQYTPLSDEDPELIIDNKCYVGTSFKAAASGWNDIFLKVDLPRFEVVGLKGWGFNMQNVTMDFSDMESDPNMVLPPEYNNIYPGSDRKLWRGFYAQEVSVMLPKGIENSKSNNKRVSFGAQHLVLDSQGVSGTFFAENVLQTGDGSAGKWAFTIEDVSISLSRNSLTGGSIGGDISVPIFEEPMDYSGYIASDGYGLEVGLNSTYKTPVFLGEMQLERNSSVAINVEDGNVYPSANLTGKLSIAGKINQQAGEAPNPDDKNGFQFTGIQFEELELQTEPGKNLIQAKAFGFEGDMNLMNFPVTISNLTLITPNDQIGLAFDLNVNLDSKGINATTRMGLLGKLKNNGAFDSWQFDRVKIDGIAIDYEKSNIHLKGDLVIMEDDPIYGNGFSGELKMTLKEINYSASGKAMFGKKDFRYWYIDVWSDKNEDKTSDKLLIDSFVGGVSHRMRKVSGNTDGFNPSKAVYEPDSDIGLSLRAGVGVSTQNKSAFNGKAYLDMEFNNNGGLNRIGFTGEGTFMNDNDGGFASGAQDMASLESTLTKVETSIGKNKKKIQQLMSNGNYLAVAQESVLKSDVAKQGSIGVYLGIEKDFTNKTFDGEFELYLDLEGIRGGGTDNLAGYAKMHTGPNDWYIHIGTPEKRISLVFSIKAVELEVGGYFMTGTQLPNQPNPHPQVVKILGSDLLNTNRKENQLTAGKGFAFGLNFIYRQNYTFAIFYASLEAGAGFDVMHAYYPNAKCVGRPGPVGNDGWYSMGQIYAYLYGKFGVEVNLFFVKGKFQIAEAGVAAMLRGQFPNPLFIQGYVGMYYNILGGLVKGRMRLKVEMGEECELENINTEVGVPMISDVTPGENSDDVSVFTAPQAVFNYPVNQSFNVDLAEGRRTFKLQLKNFTLTSEGKTIDGTLEWNNNNDAVTFKPNETLPSEREVNLLVEVSFDEKIGGSLQTLIDNGKPVVEKKELIFRTDKAPDYIPLENVVYAYPVVDQTSFYPEEYNKGYVKMKTPQHYLFESGFQMRAEFKDNLTGQAIRTNLSYDKSKATIHFEVPDMVLNAPHTLNLIAFPPGADIQQEVTIVEDDLFSEAAGGDTNWFNTDTNTQDKETRNVSGSAVISRKKANDVVIANGVPKSILDYEFKTSKHRSFRDKVNDLSVTNNLTNFIYSDVHSLSIQVADYEYLNNLEVSGGRYTESIPLVYAQAILDDQYYKRIIYPLLYENYPLDGNIKVDRDEQVLGVPPIKSFYVGTEYLANLEVNPNSQWVKNRIPFVYNLPYLYKTDMLDLRNQILSRYNSTQGDAAIYDKYKTLMESRFPAMPLGNFKAELIYRTPGNLYQKGYQIRYKND